MYELAERDDVVARLPEVRSGYCCLLSTLYRKIFDIMIPKLPALTFTT